MGAVGLCATPLYLENSGRVASCDERVQPTAGTRTPFCFLCGNRRAMNKELILTQQRLKEVVEYNPKTGLFLWKPRPTSPMFRHTGKIAGCKDHNGYISLKIDGVMYLAHRLAWLYETGAWPEDEIDHKDTTPDNNSWTNLRPADRGFNMQNRQNASYNKKSGLPLGVYKSGSAFDAKIVVNTKLQYIGRRKTVEEAQQLYIDAKRRLHPGGLL